MTKKQQKFEFTHNLKKTVVRDMKLVTEYLPLTLTGIYYCDTNFSKIDVANRYDMDIEEVIYEGMNIISVLEFTGALEDIYEETIKYAPNYFNETKTAA